MDWNIVEGKWNELKGHARDQWGKLTDDELEEVGVRRTSLWPSCNRRLRLRHRLAHRQADEWAKRQDAKQQDEGTKT